MVPPWSSYSTIARAPRAARRERGLPGLCAWWGRTAGDLVVTASAQRIVEMRGTLVRRWRGVILTLLILSLSVVTGYLNMHTDEVLVVLPWVLLVTGVVGLAAARGAWRGALLIGLAVPASQVVASLLHLRVPYPNTPQDISAACVALIPALVGVALGAALRWSMLRSIAMPPYHHRIGRAIDQ